eukprot:scaffold111383_cov18-Prasinocladus_malaysianus.AAC.1
MNAAATKIQAVQKGRKARAEVDAMRKLSVNAQDSNAEDMPDLNDPDLNAAATKIQAVQKGRTARAQVATMREAKEASTAPVSTSAASREEGIPDLNDPVSLGHADIPPAEGALYDKEAPPLSKMSNSEATRNCQYFVNNRLK